MFPPRTLNNAVKQRASTSLNYEIKIAYIQHTRLFERRTKVAFFLTYQFRFQTLILFSNLVIRFVEN